MDKLTTSYFFSNGNGLDFEQCKKICDQTLSGFDDGELYLQESQSEILVLDDQKISNANSNLVKGFGFRGVIGDVSSFAHSNNLTIEELTKASEVVKSIKNYTKPLNVNFALPNVQRNLYPKVINYYPLEDKIKLLQEIDHYVRSLSSLVKQVSVRIAVGSSIIQIISPFLANICQDLRPICQISISVTVGKDGKLESAGEGIGTREDFFSLLNKWQDIAKEAVDRALIKLEADYAPAGELTVVLGNGDPGVLLHEAVGHGLEGDFNRMKTSTYSNMIGQKVAAKGVTVIDDGTIKNSRGSLNFDDEGTPTQKNTLIEDGVLVGYMQDRMNSRLMGMQPTGNARRENFASLPMPRMTNTYMLSGDATQEEMIKSVDYGIFFPKFSGGQVDITSGNFTFEAAIAYLIEKGKLTAPLKGACLIGNGPEVMKKITAIGNDLKLDQGTGMCGKNGQSVPVGLGQPSLLIDKITVGGKKV